MAIAKWIRGAPPTAVASQVVSPQPVHITPADEKRFGFENFGNICYANSVLQALYFCSPFRELLLQSADPSLSTTQKPSPAATTPPSPVQSTAALAGRRKPEHKPTAEALPTLGTNPTTALPIPSSPVTLFSALRSLFLHISRNPLDKGTVAPRAFIEKLKEVNMEFRNTNQQDAHEFLNFLLNKIVEEIVEDRKNQPSSPSKEDLSNSVGTLFSSTIATASPSSNSGTSPQDATLVHKLFEGVLTSETRCLTCETVSSRDESFLDLSIDIEQNSSVTACLRQFSASEMLCQKNKFFCDSCCDLQEAEKRMKIKKLPNVLALHLKRFKYQEDVQKYIKLAYRVAFPFELRLFNTVDDAQDPDRLYELFAIVVHIGNGPHHGHYVTIIKTHGTWLIYDDETVDSIKESEISKYFGDSNSGSAYVLYYQAVDLDMGALGLRPPTPIPIPDHLSVPKRSSPEPSASPILAPSLPPGLADVPVALDLTDALTPHSPMQGSPVIPFIERSPLRSPSLQPLTVNVSPPDVPMQNLESSPPASPVPTAPGKLFQPLRHSPSVRTRGSVSTTASTVEKRRSIREKFTPSRPSTSQGTPHPDEASPPEVPSSAAPPLPVRGTEEPDTVKDRGPGRKPSFWSKLKNGKRPGTATEIPLSPQPGTAFSPPPSMTQFPPRPSAPEVNSLRSSEPVVRSVESTTTPPSSYPKKSHMAKQSLDLGLTPLNGNGTLSHRHGHESSSPGSATSSFTSTSAQAETSYSSPSLPPIPASPPGPTIRQPIYGVSPSVSAKAHQAIEHQRSQPQLHLRKASLADLPPSPTRPRTGEASTATFPRARTLESEILPPLPTFNQSARRRTSADQGSDTTGTSTSDGRPVSTSDNLESGPSPPGTLPMPPKRSSRKLSISVPIPNFGRREKKEKTFAYEKVAERNAKDREKEAKAKAKEKEKEDKVRRKQEDKKKQEQGLASSPSSYPNLKPMSRF